MATYTKAQAAEELARYTRQQTENTNARLAALEQTLQEALAAADRTAAADSSNAHQTAVAAYDAARIRQLTQQYRVAEQIANRGLSRSGEATSAAAALKRQEQTAFRRATTVRDAALAEILKKQQTAHQTARRTYETSAADQRRKLAQNIENKRLTLARNTKEETV